MIKLQTNKTKFKPIAETLKNFGAESAIELTKSGIKILYFDGNVFYGLTLTSDFFDNYELPENTQIAVSNNLFYEAINKASDDIFFQIEDAFMKIYSGNKEYVLRLLDTKNVDFKTREEASKQVEEVDSKLTFKAKVNGELLKTSLGDLLVKSDDVTISYNDKNKVITLSSYNEHGTGSLIFLKPEEATATELKSKFYDKYIIDAINNTTNIDATLTLTGGIDMPIKIISKGLNSEITCLIAPRIDVK